MTMVISSPFDYLAFYPRKISAFSYLLGILILLLLNCAISILKAYTVTNTILSLDLCNLHFLMLFFSFVLFFALELNMY